MNWFIFWVYVIGVVFCFTYWTIGQYPKEMKREAFTISPFWPLVVTWFAIKLVVVLPKAIYEDMKNLDT